MTEHPITPPPELVEWWVQTTESNDCIGAYPTNFEQRICTAAARWGADQELEACCEWLRDNGLYETRIGHLRAARRPKPPSLKEQALEVVTGLEKRWDLQCDLTLLRLALEQLDD
jgi:hypothetical protein